MLAGYDSPERPPKLLPLGLGTTPDGCVVFIKIIGWFVGAEISLPLKLLELLLKLLRFSGVDYDS